MADSNTTQFKNNVSITGNLDVDGSITAASEIFEGAQTITAASANALAVGRLGATTPAFQVDTATSLSATGLKVTGAASLSGVALAAIGGAAESLTIDSKGTGTLTLNGTATGGITLGRAVTLSSTINKLTLTAPATAATLTIIDGTTVTGPAATGTLATLAGSETLTNKTLTAPVIGAATGTSLSVTAGYTAKSATAAPASAGALAAGAPITMFSNGIKFWVTSDAPAFSATKGDICINLAGSSSSTRLFINDGTTTWIAITTAT